MIFLSELRQDIGRVLRGNMEFLVFPVGSFVQSLVHSKGDMCRPETAQFLDKHARLVFTNKVLFDPLAHGKSQSVREPMILPVFYLIKKLINQLKK